MNIVVAVLVVGAGSLLFRLVPLLSTRRLPERVTQAAGWAGLAVIAGISVRSVLLFQDTSIPAAPVVAAASVMAGLTLAFRRRSVLIAVGVGASSYLVISAVMGTLA